MTRARIPDIFINKKEQSGKDFLVQKTTKNFGKKSSERYTQANVLKVH